MMFTPELLRLVVRLVGSWQVIAVTVVLILYFTLVSYVARLYHRPGSFSFTPKPKKQKPGKAPPPDTEEDVNDEELGLEEE
ncbi:MAG: hypothetical protein LBI67_02685 [Treponema sp.]|jgi:hypothetical protein|nr:hypothetical protein [Treponema sp.]